MYVFRKRTEPRFLQKMTSMKRIAMIDDDQNPKSKPARVMLASRVVSVPRAGLLFGFDLFARRANAAHFLA